MENYKIILDEEELDKFISSLPEEKPDEVYYVCLFARSKYLTEGQKGDIKHIKSDKAQLKRFISKKSRLKTDIQQLECPINTYIQHKGTSHNIVPQNALALYITVNPRSLSLATRSSLKKFVEMISDNPTHKFNPVEFSLSELQRSCISKKPWHIIDIDKKDVDLSVLPSILGSTPYRVLETRGGYHIMISLHEIDNNIKKSWYNDIKSVFGEWLDQQGDIMIPIPGTSQGNFKPRFKMVE